VANQPNKWIACLLGVFAPPLAMMYVARTGWAAFYLLAALLIGLLLEFYLHDVPGAGLIQILFMLVCASHAYRLAAGFHEEKTRPAYSRWYGLVTGGLLLFALAFGIRAFLVEPFRAPSASMLPSIPVRAHLIVQKWGYGNYGTYGLNLARSAISAALNRGDIIVFEYPQDRSISYVKRLIGLPGDKLVYRGKSLFINGIAVPTRRDGNFFDTTSVDSFQKYIESPDSAEYAILIDDNYLAASPAAADFPFREHCTFDPQGLSCEVPAGHYFTLGDNRDHSSDSRMWGFVPADHIVGKVVRILP
jgi:signal peptidase I